jgi:acyl-CoA synthetase (NDP forming)
MTDRDARELIASIRGAALLNGYRGAAPVDLDGLRSLLVRVARLADDCTEIAELDLNPVIAGVDGVVAVDAKVRIAPYVPGPPDVRRMR